MYTDSSPLFVRLSRMKPPSTCLVLAKLRLDTCSTSSCRQRSRLVYRHAGSLTASNPSRKRETEPNTNNSKPSRQEPLHLRVQPPSTYLRTTISTDAAMTGRRILRFACCRCRSKTHIAPCQSFIARIVVGVCGVITVRQVLPGIRAKATSCLFPYSCAKFTSSRAFTNRASKCSRGRALPSA